MTTNCIEINPKAKIYNGKSEEVIPTLKDNSIDLVITSPPYNVDLGNNKFNENPYNIYNDNLEHKDYIAWLKDLFDKLYPKIVYGGRICLNIGDGKHGRIPTHSDIIHFMTNELRYIPMANIFWQKNTIGSRLSWGSYASPSCPSFPCPIEHIMVFAKDNIKLQTTGETDLTPEEFKKWAYSLWTMTAETKMKEIGHPAVFPVELPYRLIKMLSWKNSTILDIFNGSGTTGVACAQLNRNYIGIELSKEYCDISVKRINGVRPIYETDMFAME